MGIYEVGAMDTFVKMLTSDEVHYDVVAGVSVGSLNASGIAIFDKGEET